MPENKIPNGCPFSGANKPETNESEKGGKPNLRIKIAQPKKLVNHLTLDESLESLHSKQSCGIDTQCTEKVCLSSVMGIPGRGDEPRTPEEVYVEAEEFLKQYFASIRRENSEAYHSRLRQVKKELDETGTYQLNSLELVYGCKLAWRNATRCIGRIQWKKLQIFDCREVTTASGMFESLCTHIKYATNKGNIRSAITIFRQRTDGKHDYRIWNPQLIGYAGYRQEDGSVVGDPGRVEFTDICIKLGWKPPGTAWDILPLVVSAEGKDPEYFDIPREIIMEVKMTHPEYKWFEELDMKWYALPAVSNMRLDCGGLEFTGTAFNGWYMGTEIGCRNFCDTQRLNVIEKVADKLGLDTTSPMTLWRDRALVEVNIAVLHSFMQDNVVIVDHHSASEQFIKHLDNESKSRSGCPADWIWIVPPMSGSLTSVFHQEMALYFIRPSYDYQEPAWKTFKWTKPDGNAVKRRFHFKQIARAVKFTSKLFGRALSKRIKATILFGTETGKSEQYAKELTTIFSYAFNANVQSMADYDMFSIEHETLLLIVTSTSGNGDPPANAVDFAEHLFQLCNEEAQSGNNPMSGSHSVKTPTSKAKSFMRSNSIAVTSKEFKAALSRVESNKSSMAGASSVENIGPLSNVCFAVFALGSSAYPKFCNFGKNMDQLLGDLGGERILDVATGDEILGQEQQFKEWAAKIFQVSCESFCLDNSEIVEQAHSLFGNILSEDTVRFGKPPKTPVSLKSALETSFRKNLITCTVKDNQHLADSTADRATIYVDIESSDELKYDPGDHVGILACNRREIVDTVLRRLKEVDDYDKTMQLQVQKETLTPTGSVKKWEPHERIPPATVRELFTRFLDITTPPTTCLLNYLATTCSKESEKEKLKTLATDSDKYDDWRHNNYPHLGEVLKMFPSAKPQASMLAAMLPQLQPRLYSISSTPLQNSKKIQITVAVVVYDTQGGNTHYGVCSTYLEGVKKGHELFVYIRRAPNFHMPRDISAPIIMVGPGTGIAPFRGFWNHRSYQVENQKLQNKPGALWLFFGCRTKSMDLYKEEKEKNVKNGILYKHSLALSREKGVPKKYVQDLLEEEGEEICRMLMEEKGHFYVCGDCKMAEDVQQRLKGILKKHSKHSDEDVTDFLYSLMDENRYHQDIFGITLRTAEVHSASHEFARKYRIESAKSEP